MMGDLQPPAPDPISAMPIRIEYWLQGPEEGHFARCYFLTDEHRAYCLEVGREVQALLEFLTGQPISALVER